VGIDLRFGAGGTATVREGVQMADADGHYALPTAALMRAAAWTSWPRASIL
jgi:hypothetical protein